MSKRICIVANVWLAIWFFFDMTGLKIGSFNLVQSAWQDDGIFFTIFIALFVLFLVKDKYGKYPLTVWILLWLVTQFFSHWYYTIFGVTEKKLIGYNNYFANTYHIVPTSDSVLVPDLYHILLHVFIGIALTCMIIFCMRNKEEEYSKYRKMSIYDK